MSKKIWIIIGVILILVTSAGAVLFTTYTFFAKQDGSIVINGSEMKRCPLFLGYTSFFSGSYSWQDNLQSFSGASILYNFTGLNAGEYKDQRCGIYNNDSTDTYNITFSIDDSWFDNLSNQNYGFTYGLCNSEYQDLVGQTIQLIPKHSFEFNIWYSVDPMMITPTSGYVSPQVIINATRWGE